MIERPEARDPANRTGLITTAFAAALVTLLMLVVTANQDGLGPPSTIPGWLPLGLLYGAPAVIGLLGASSGRGSLLAAAGLLYVPLAVLAFSGVTLPFLVPALLYLGAATRPEPAEAALDRPGSPRSGFRRWTIVLAAALASAPVVVWVVLNLGIIGVVGLVVVAWLAPALVERARQSGRAPTTGRTGEGGLAGGDGWAQLRGMLAAAAIVALVLAAGAGAFATTEERCWTRADTPGGPVFEPIPSANTFTAGSGESGGVALGESGGGCASGQYTLGGIALEASLVLVAIGMATFLARGIWSRPTSF